MLFEVVFAAFVEFLFEGGGAELVDIEGEGEIDGFGDLGVSGFGAAEFVGLFPEESDFLDDEVGG